MIEALHSVPAASRKPQQGNLGSIPAAAKAILIQGIHQHLTAREIRPSLHQAGIRKTERTVMIWMKVIRRWLGFPPLHPCSSSERYRRAVDQSIDRNGFPAAAEIQAGWQPSLVADRHTAA